MFFSLIHTTVFRLTLIYVATFALACALLVGAFFWRANDLLTAQVVQTLASEVTGLREQFALGGMPLLRRAVSERAATPGNGLYLLVDGRNRRLAGNLNAFPKFRDGGPRGKVFEYERPVHRFSAPQSTTGEGLLSGGRVPRDVGQPDQVAGASRSADGAPLGAGSAPGNGEATQNAHGEKPRRIVSRLAVGIVIPIETGGALLVGRDIDDQRAFVEHAKRLMLAGLAVMAALGMIAGALASRAVLARIRTITDAADRIMDGQLQERIPLKGSNDEMDRLSARLNEMLTRIEALVARVREVSDNIAHDLKTPLNRLRARAEAALRETAPRGTAAERAHTQSVAGGQPGAEADVVVAPGAPLEEAVPHLRNVLSEVVEDADRMMLTFNALLNIARLEAGAAQLETEPLDLSELVQTIAEFYEPMAEDAGARFDVSVVPSAMVRGNGPLLTQMISNLLDNALKYGLAGDGSGPVTVELSVARDGKEATVCVADRGPGIAPEQRSRVLERFVRLDESRTAPGSGLGLSLVSAIAKLHAARIALEDNAPGLRVAVTFPLLR